MRRLWPILVVFALVAAACSSDPDAEPTTLVPVVTEPSLQPIRWAEDHLVNIRSEGQFAGSPHAGQGTGLVVDLAGLILAPATAVVGADRVNVDVAGVEFPLVADVEAVAECPNLALLSIDHDFDSVASPSAGSTPAFAAWATDGEWQIADPSLAPDRPGTMLVDLDGGVVTMHLERSSLTSASDVADVGAAMRRREITTQLGFAVVDADGGGVVVTSIADGDGLETDLRPGDVITSLDGVDLTQGVAELCGSPPVPSMPLEVMREGSRYEGVYAVEALHPGSWRTTDELGEAVVRIDVDVDGDGLRDPNGSGFFVSSDGFVVTNYHVVSGSNTVGVTWDGGQRTEQGTVIGRSSCADLAVIDVPGDEYEYLEWSQVAVALEQPVRAIGFPIGTNQLTIQPGAVSKDTVDPFINSPALPQFEHSAQIIGGNSGGPVVNENGEVIGVTNAAFELGAAQEGFALMGASVAPVVQDLLAGDSQHIGAELTPVRWESGVAWQVESVDNDSIAGQADLRRGDIIERLGGLDYLTDGFTLESICDTVLSTSSPIPVQIARGFADDKWDGELRGRPIERIPDPIFVASTDGVVGTFLPGRWTGYERIVPDDVDDFRGFRAGLEGFDWSNEFGRKPYARMLASLQMADARTTEEQLASEGYGDICKDRVVSPSVVGSLVGHVQVWSDCAHGVEIISHAWTDTSQSPSPMVLLLVIDDPVDLQDTVDRAIGNIEVGKFPPPQPVDEGESEG